MEESRDVAISGLLLLSALFKNQPRGHYRAPGRPALVPRAMVNAAQMVKEKKCQPECNGGVIVCEAIELFGLCSQCSRLQLWLCLGLQYHNAGVPSNF
jgi:hypothetical protein